MIHILLIGGTGCVGSATREALTQLAPSARVTILTRDSAKTQGAQAEHYATGNILDKASLVKALQENTITHVLHCAALRTTDCAENPSLAYQMNVLGTQNVMEAIAEYGGVQRLVFTSTAAIYAVGDKPNAHTSEEAPKQLLNPYTATKLAGEALLEGNAYHRQQATTILRPQVIYGPHRLSEGSTAGITVAIAKAKQGEAFTIPFSGTTGFHYSADVGLAHALALLESPEHFYCYNLPAESISIEAICQKLNDAAGATLIEKREHSYPFPAGLDSQKFVAAFPSFEQTTFDEAIKKAFSSHETS